MNIDVRAHAGLTGLTVAAAAAAIISAPIALADPIPDPPAPSPDVVTQAAATEAPPAAAQAGVPHLSSPENLPPGTTDVPVNEGPRTSYLRGIWHAIQNQDLTWKDGLLMLAQRPMDAGAAPPPGVPAGPQAPGPAEPAPPTP
ncbi:MAG: dopamine receptor D4 [Candidatus Sericytochromatia bacterium]